MFLAGASACAEVLGWGRAGGFKERQGGSGSCSTVRWGWSGGWFLLPPHPLPLPESRPQSALLGTLQGPLLGFCLHPSLVCLFTVIRRIQLTTTLAHVPPVLSTIRGSHHTGWEKSQSPHLAHRPCRVWPRSSRLHLLPSPPPPPAALASLLFEPTNVLSPHSFCLLVPLSRTRLTISS